MAATLSSTRRSDWFQDREPSRRAGLHVAARFRPQRSHLSGVPASRRTGSARSWRHLRNRHESRVPVRLTWPAGHPFVNAAAYLREADGRETIKLFITEQPADFFTLEQHGVRSTPASSSPLTLLLRRAFHGLATRDIAMTPVGAEDWTTVSRSFVLRRKTSAPLPSDGAPSSSGPPPCRLPASPVPRGQGLARRDGRRRIGSSTTRSAARCPRQASR